MLAAKMALAIRVDALGEDTEATVAKAFKDYVERKVNACEDGDDINASRKHLKKAAQMSAATAKVGAAAGYNQDADVVVDEEGAKKKKRSRDEAADAAGAEGAGAEEAGEPAKKKKKKNKEGKATAKPLEA